MTTTDPKAIFLLLATGIWQTLWEKKVFTADGIRDLSTCKLREIFNQHGCYYQSTNEIPKKGSFCPKIALHFSYNGNPFTLCINLPPKPNMFGGQIIDEEKQVILAFRNESHTLKEIR